jgi:hypothetical protein
VQRHAYRDNLVILAVLLELEGVVALITYLTGESLTRVSRSLLPRPHQNLPNYGLEHHNLTLHKAKQAIILLRNLFCFILTRLRIVPTLSAPSTASLGGLTPFSAHLLLWLLTITTRPELP